MTDVTDVAPVGADDPALALSTAPATGDPAPPPGGRPRPLLAARRAWRQLTSMRTALVLLFLLALAAIPGSVIPQRGLNSSAVRLFYRQHPTLAPIMNRLWLFDVFAAPWFAAIYLLLFVSLIGCLVPRVRLHVRALRAAPPAAPRRLSRLSFHASWSATAPPAEAVAAAARTLRRRRFRVLVRAEDAAVSLGAEKGYLRETGNLVFHIALLLLLVGIALGGMFGYKGDVLVTSGQGFANIPASYDDFHPARLFSASSMTPFSFTLRGFHASYQANGQPLSYDSPVVYRAAPVAPLRRYDIRVNHPLAIHGTKVYLIGHGYSPVIVVHDPDGRVAFDAPVPFLPQDNDFTSDGVVKVPDASPDQIGLSGFLAPTATFDPARGIVSTYPAARRPLLVLTAYHGDLGLNSGAPQSVWTLDTSHLSQFRDATGAPLTAVLKVGESWRLPDGETVTFAGLKQYGTYQITYDPGRYVALLAAILIIGGLIASLRVRRRRVWVRASAGPDGRTVVEVAGLAREDVESFGEEFDDLTARLRAAEGD